MGVGQGGKWERTGTDLGAAPVTTLGVVLDLRVALETEPLGDRAVNSRKVGSAFRPVAAASSYTSAPRRASARNVRDAFRRMGRGEAGEDGWRGGEVKGDEPVLLGSLGKDDLGAESLVGRHLATGREEEGGNLAIGSRWEVEVESRRGGKGRGQPHRA